MSEIPYTKRTTSTLRGVLGHLLAGGDCTGGSVGDGDGASRRMHARSCNVVSLVGGGGKTTFMYNLCAELLPHHLCVCVTTTHIGPPTDPTHVLHLVSSAEQMINEVHALLAAYATPDFDRHTTHIFAKEQLGPHKIKGVDEAWMDACAAATAAHPITYVVEADGARCLPFKAPAAHEPAVPASTTIFVAVVGLRVLGAPLDEGHVCRCPLVRRFSPSPVPVPAPIPVPALTPVPVVDEDLILSVCVDDVAGLMKGSRGRGREGDGETEAGTAHTPVPRQVPRPSPGEIIDNDGLDPAAGITVLDAVPPPAYDGAARGVRPTRVVMLNQLDSVPAERMAGVYRMMREIIECSRRPGGPDPRPCTVDMVAIGNLNRTGMRQR